MSHEDPERQEALRQQERMFRLAERDYGLSRRAISLETGIPVPTLKSWAHDTVLPLSGLRKLVRVIPDDLTSLLFTGTDKCIAPIVGDDGALDALAGSASELVVEHLRARHPDSPGGVHIVPQEAEKIKSIGRRVCSHARAVAA
jgi:hypothetical protein